MRCGPFIEVRLIALGIKSSTVLCPGSEVEIWTNIGEMEDNDPNVVDFQFVNPDPGFNWRTRHFADRPQESLCCWSDHRATDIDLRAFLLQGKLIAYQGWNNP